MIVFYGFRPFMNNLKERSVDKMVIKNEVLNGF